MSLKIIHKVLKDKRGKIRFRKFLKGGYDHYNIKLFIEGSELSNVDHVDYELHPTFSEPLRTTNDAKSGFTITIWTWGEFEIGVTVYMQNAGKKEFIYNLKYSNELPNDDSAYIDETPAKYKED